jgi:hypothetical protein
MSGELRVNSLIALFVAFSLPFSVMAQPLSPPPDQELWSALTALKDRADNHLLANRLLKATIVSSLTGFGSYALDHANGYVGLVALQSSRPSRLP